MNRKLSTAKLLLSLIVVLCLQQAVLLQGVRAADADRLIARGVAEHRAGRHENAIKLYKQALVAHPKHTLAYLYLGECYMENCELDKARDAFNNAIRYALSGQRKEVLRARERLLKLDNERHPCAERLLGQAAAEFKKRNWVNTISLCRAATELDSLYAKPYYYLGAAYAELGRKEEACKAFSTNLYLDRTGPDAYYVQRQIDLLCPSNTPADPIRVSYNGERVALDTEPIMRNGRLMVPVDTILEKMGYMKADYDRVLQKIIYTRNDRSIELQINSRVVRISEPVGAVMNLRKIILAEPVIKHRDYALVPVNFLSELNENVEWLPQERVLYIGYKEKPRPVIPPVLKPPVVSLPIVKPPVVKPPAVVPPVKPPLDPPLWYSRTWTGHTGWVLAVAVAPDSTTVASAGMDGTIRLWDAQTGAQKKSLAGHVGTVCAVAFSPDGRTLASGGMDKTVRLWDLSSGQSRILEGEPGREAGHPQGRHREAVRAVAFSPDGGLLVTGSRREGDFLAEGDLKVWELTTGRVKQTLTLVVGSHAVAFSPNGRLLASTAASFPVSMWKLEGDKFVLAPALSGRWREMRGLAFAPDSKSIATGNEDNNVRLWAITSAARELRWTTGRAHDLHRSDVLTVAFTPDGRTIASGSADRTIRLWEAETGTLRQVLTRHSQPVTSVAFSRDGNFLVSGSYDGTVILWRKQR